MCLWELGMAAIVIRRANDVGGRIKGGYGINYIWVWKLTSASGGDRSLLEIHGHALHQWPSFVINWMCLWKLGSTSGVT